ncbi:MULTISPECIES: ABC transporter permease [unclassified Nocardioides]|uniref:ABC transporter permease n=1 Tax=unclassified Nocardioides TaxID=2615069 RepID=UPI0006FE686A|nr:MULTISPECIES: ABC transporter permease [unclassified Nocardioides]KQY50974.1 peptide ABC transporter [Nocardioides sp. Root140]KQZ75529.1 peptide ABC transporter [Nocardioides sp. Root151]KRF14605.1 peptide ABC transporter [Nocardioides sp. Soil796]
MRRIALRAGELLAVLFVVSFGVFAMVTLMPGDPAVAILGEGHPKQDYVDLRQELGLDDPLLTRYWHWLSSAVTGDLGRSLVPPQGDVTDRILGALPVSFQLATMGLLIALVLAVPLAMWSAAHAGGLVDRIISASMFAILSIPSFLAGLLLIMVFANGLGWFPRAQWVRISEDLPANLHHALLPALVIAMMELALFTRILRNDLIVTLNEDYILAARAKGMPPWRIMVTDALRPSSFSLVTLMGISLGRLIGSTVIVEYLFALPGMGSMIVTAANQGDFPLVQGAVLIIALVYVVVNASIDVSYGYLDPRTRRVHA